MGDLLHFPPQAVRCTGCGFPIALRRGEEPADKPLCFCCRHQIKLPGTHVVDGDPNACVDCGGSGTWIVGDPVRGVSDATVVRGTVTACPYCGGTGKKVR